MVQVWLKVGVYLTAKPGGLALTGDLHQNLTGHAGNEYQNYELLIGLCLCEREEEISVFPENSGV